MIDSTEIEKAKKLFDKYGVDYENNKTISSFLEIVKTCDNGLERFIMFSLKELIVDLHTIKEKDEKSYCRYLREINNSKGETRYWGHRFELFFHNRLQRGIPRFFDYIRRGKDGQEPDFLLSKNNIELGIELTTLQFEGNDGNLDTVLRKIKDRIIEKNNNKYANEQCLLVINITNLNAIGKLNDFDLMNEIKSERVDFKYLKDVNFKFGCVFLVEHLYGILNDGNLDHYFEPQLCIFDDRKEMDNNLKVLINILFPYVDRTYENLEGRIYLRNI